LFRVNCKVILLLMIIYLIFQIKKAWNEVKRLTMQLITSTMIIGPPTLKNQFQFVSGYWPVMSGGKKPISMFVSISKTPKLIIIATKNFVMRDLFMFVLSLYLSKFASILRIFFKIKLIKEMANEITAERKIFKTWSQKKLSQSL